LQLPAGSLADPQLQPLASLLAPIKVLVSPEPVTGAGSDVEGLEAKGVPVFAINQDASRYFDYHHSADDTLAIVDRAQLNQNVAAWAVILDTIADSTVTFRKAPDTRPQ
jgi:Zn-dependent M28 family amino/carboxypeptidase